MRLKDKLKKIRKLEGQICELLGETPCFDYHEKTRVLYTRGNKIDYDTHECGMSYLQALQDTVEYIQERKRIIGE